MFNVDDIERERREEKRREEKRREERERERQTESGRKICNHICRGNI